MGDSLYGIGSITPADMTTMSVALQQFAGPDINSAPLIVPAGRFVDLLELCDRANEVSKPLLVPFDCFNRDRLRSLIGRGSVVRG